MILNLIKVYFNWLRGFAFNEELFLLFKEFMKLFSKYIIFSSFFYKLRLGGDKFNVLEINENLSFLYFFYCSLKKCEKVKEPRDD